MSPTPTQIELDERAVTPEAETSQETAADTIGMDFTIMIRALLKGKRATRMSWNDPHEVVYLDGDFVTIQTKANNFDPRRWIVSRGDMLGTDWQVV